MEGYQNKIISKQIMMEYGFSVGEGTVQSTVLSQPLYTYLLTFCAAPKIVMLVSLSKIGYYKCSLHEYWKISLQTISIVNWINLERIRDRAKTKHV